MAEDNNNLLFSNEVLSEVEASSLGSKVKSGPVTVLGRTFANDEERRSFFRAELRKKLPELKKVEGYPMCDDETVIELSDPPYYTLCANPWLNDFIDMWNAQKPSDDGIERATTPYSSPIHSKKNLKIYNAHSYHTKVPHDVVMRYYLYYTKPGDIVVDNFCGTGMSGVAANETANTKDYSEIAAEFKKLGKKVQWGYRNCILGDLSPIASFISHNYTSSVNTRDFVKAAKDIYQKLVEKCSWMLQTKHTDGGIGEINYVIWSEVQSCPHCGTRFSYWDAAVDFDNNKVSDPYKCPSCGSSISKKDSIKARKTYYDEGIKQTNEIIDYVPAIVNYTYKGKRYERPVNDFDLVIIERINETPIETWYPTNKMMGVGEKWGDTWRAGYHVGFNNVHNFFTRRNLAFLSCFYDLIRNYECDSRLKSYLTAWFTSSLSRLHIMNRYAPKHHRHVGPLANTLYVSGTPTEISPLYFIKSKISDNTLNIRSNDNVLVQVASATSSGIKSNSVDYIFTDPPFGGNIMYSELNFISESWLKTATNNREEAITNDSQQKGNNEYQDLMLKSFEEYYRILKPNRWMTVEFSNTSAAIWNAIQQAIQQAGFVIAYVTDLNKGRGGLHGIYNVVAVNQDLAISCYKPSDSIETQAYNEHLNVWDFVEDFLNHVPVHLQEGEATASIIERSAKILYDRVITYYVQKGLPVPIDASDFQAGLRERFEECDGMFFTAAQKNDYLEKKKLAPEFVPMGLIVSNEADGIEWLRNRLRDNSQTYQDIQPDWMQAINGIRKGDILPELSALLEENFIEEPDGKWRLPNIQDDVDKDRLREKALLREFKTYVEAASKPHARIKEVRVEAIRAGFKKCYMDKDFATIVMVGDKIPQNLLTEDDILLQFYDIARTRI